MSELWQPIPGFDGYEASSEGRIRSPRRVLKGWMGGRYREVAIFGKTKRVHRLVAAAFHGEPKPGMQALHRDDNPLNNKAENIYWGTPKQNMEDRAAHGNMPVGEDHKCSKLTAEQVLEIRHLAERGVFQKEIARDFGISQPQVSDIFNRKCWAHLP